LLQVLEASKLVEQALQVFISNHYFCVRSCTIVSQQEANCLRIV